MKNCIKNRETNVLPEGENVKKNAFPTQPIITLVQIKDYGTLKDLFL